MELINAMRAIAEQMNHHPVRDCVRTNTHTPTHERNPNSRPIHAQTSHPFLNTCTKKRQTFHLTKYRHLVVELSSAATLSLTCYDLQQADLFDALPFRPHKP